MEWNSPENCVKIQIGMCSYKFDNIELNAAYRCASEYAPLRNFNFNPKFNNSRNRIDTLTSLNCWAWSWYVLALSCPSAPIPSPWQRPISGPFCARREGAAEVRRSSVECPFRPHEVRWIDECLARSASIMCERIRLYKRENIDYDDKAQKTNERGKSDESSIFMSVGVLYTSEISGLKLSSWRFHSPNRNSRTSLA